MSYHLVLDTEAGPDIATTSGWSDFTAWVEGLSDIDALHHFAEYGWSEQIPDVVIDLTAALERGEPSDDQRSIGEALLAGLKARGEATVAVVANGAEADEGEEDEE